MFRPMPVRATVMALLVLLLALPGTAAAAAWSTPVHFGGTSGAAPSPAVDASGDALVGWQAGSLSVIQAARHGVGTPGFAALPNLSPTSAGDAASPVVVLNGSGNGVAAWVHTLDSMANKEIDILALLSNGKPGGLTTVSAAGANASNITAAINANGDAVVAWARSGDVEAVTRQGLNGTFTDTTNPKKVDVLGSNPVAAIDGAGNAIVVMQHTGGAVSADRHPPGGQWQPTETLTPSGLHSFSPPDVAANAGGAMVVAFIDNDGGGNRIASYVSGTVAVGWGSPTVKALSTDSASHGPQVTVAANGAALVGWTTFSAVQTAFRPAGGDFPAPGSGSSIATGTPDDFALAGSGRGDAVVAWSTFDTQFMQNVVRAAVRPAGAGGFGAPTIVSNTKLYGSTPRIALDEQGDAVLAYPEGATPTGVDIATFDASAPQVTAFSGPSRVTAGTPATFSTNVTDAFSPFTTKWSFGDGGSGTGSSVSHTFTRPGRFTVTLAATDTAGNATSQSLTVTVNAKPLPRCIVPKLKGKTLSQAKKLLSKAHCKLGKVHAPKPRKHHKLPKLVVARTSPGAAASRPNGTKVVLTLGPAPKPKPKPKKH